MAKGKRSRVRLGFHAAEAMRITGCSELEAAAVEEIMRNNIFHSTLDWQSPEQYRAGALEAYEVLKHMRDLGVLPRSYQRLLQGKRKGGRNRLTFSPSASAPK
jgi:hypothetical protein